MMRILGHKSAQIAFIAAILWIVIIAALPASAEQLDLQPLGVDPWMSGPESLTNGQFMLQSPNPVDECREPVPLWVVDLGVTIPDEQGNLSMIVGGDTFYLSGRNEMQCRASGGTKLAWCRGVKLPALEDAYFEQSCTIDEDCPPPANGLAYRCWQPQQWCVTEEVYNFCTHLFDPKLIPDVVKFCIKMRGRHEIPGQAPLYDETFCDWIQGDLRCMTELYDDTCSKECMLHGGLPECDDPCTVECIQACNRKGTCDHRNNTFYDASIEADGQGGYVVKLLKDHPELIMKRDWEEGRGVALFGVYPYDYFRDRTGALYIFSDTRVWLSWSVPKEIRRSGVGIYSLTENRRFVFEGYSQKRPLTAAWKGEPVPPEVLPQVQGDSDYIAWQRASQFSEIAVVRDLRRSPYQPDNSETYIHVLGAGVSCAPEDVLCLRSIHSGLAYLSRIPDDPKSIADPMTWEYYGGMVNDRPVWHPASATPHGQELSKPLFGLSAFFPSSVMKYKQEYLHIAVLASSAEGPNDALQLLRSPDGIHWFDGGWYPLVEKEKPQRTKFAYCPRWLQKNELPNGNLGILISHWLSYEGYLRAAEESKRFRDYNMRSFQLPPPQSRAFLVHSDSYTPTKTGVLDLPIHVYQPKDKRRYHVAMQYCSCTEAQVKQGTCRTGCAPWQPFSAKKQDSSKWKWAEKLNASKRVSALDGVATVTVPAPKQWRTSLKLTWNWKKEGVSAAAVVLRFGLVDIDQPLPFKQMTQALRVLPEVFERDWTLWQKPLGFHASDPIPLR